MRILTLSSSPRKTIFMWIFVHTQCHTLTAQAHSCPSIFIEDFWYRIFVGIFCWKCEMSPVQCVQLNKYNSKCHLRIVNVVTIFHVTLRIVKFRWFVYYSYISAINITRQGIQCIRCRCLRTSHFRIDRMCRLMHRCEGNEFYGCVIQNVHRATVSSAANIKMGFGKAAKMQRCRKTNNCHSYSHPKQFQR